MAAGRMGSVGEATNSFRVMRATGAIVLRLALGTGRLRLDGERRAARDDFTEARANVGVQLSDALCSKRPTRRHSRPRSIRERRDHGG